MINCNYCKYSDRRSTEEPCQSCQKDKAAWAYFVLKESEPSKNSIIQQIEDIISDCEEIQESHESEYTKKCARLSAYDDIKDLIIGRAEECTKETIMIMGPGPYPTCDSFEPYDESEGAE